MDKDKLKRAKNIAHRLLKYRIRSEKELSRRLKLKKIPQDIITAVLDDLKKVSLVNDEEFTSLWVQEGTRKGYGPLRIKRQLREKGIKEELIRDFLGRFQDKQVSALLIDELIRRRVKRYKGKTLPEIKRKLSYYLRARGFSFEDIQHALENLEAFLNL